MLLGADSELGPRIFHPEETDVIKDISDEEDKPILERVYDSSQTETDEDSSSQDGGRSESGDSEVKQIVQDYPVNEHQIREVWAHNLVEEFRNIIDLVGLYPFVAMDTEFPGVVAKPIGNFSTMDEYRYKQVKCNVDLLKLIQLGISLFDCSGNLPTGVCTWQFNFNFNLSEDLYAEDSIDLLQSSGLNFNHHSADGIDPADFSELLISSGLVLMDNVTWLTFHSAYDFGYLLSQLTGQKLPESESEFLETLKIYFPNIYDIKYLMMATDSLCGGLQRVANRLKVNRVGIQHQAGSDSLLTGQVFFAMYNKYFAKSGLDDVKYSGQICGFGNNFPVGASGLPLPYNDDSILNSEFEELNTNSPPSPMREH